MEAEIPIPGDVTPEEEARKRADELAADTTGMTQIGNKSQSSGPSEMLKTQMVLEDQKHRHAMERREFYGNVGLKGIAIIGGLVVIGLGFPAGGAICVGFGLGMVSDKWIPKVLGVKSEITQ